MEKTSIACDEKNSESIELKEKVQTLTDKIIQMEESCAERYEMKQHSKSVQGTQTCDGDILKLEVKPHNFSEVVDSRIRELEEQLEQEHQSGSFLLITNQQLRESHQDQITQLNKCIEEMGFDIVIQDNGSSTALILQNPEKLKQYLLSGSGHLCVLCGKSSEVQTNQENSDVQAIRNELKLQQDINAALKQMLCNGIDVSVENEGHHNRTLKEFTLEMVTLSKILQHQVTEQKKKIADLVEEVIQLKLKYLNEQQTQAMNSHREKQSRKRTKCKQQGFLQQVANKNENIKEGYVLFKTEVDECVSKADTSKSEENFDSDPSVLSDKFKQGNVTHPLQPQQIVGNQTPEYKPLVDQQLFTQQKELPQQGADLKLLSDQQLPSQAVQTRVHQQLTQQQHEPRVLVNENASCIPIDETSSDESGVQSLSSRATCKNPNDTASDVQNTPHWEPVHNLKKPGVRSKMWLTKLGQDYFAPCQPPQNVQGNLIKPQGAAHVVNKTVSGLSTGTPVPRVMHKIVCSSESAAVPVVPIVPIVNGMSDTPAGEYSEGFFLTSDVIVGASEQPHVVCQQTESSSKSRATVPSDIQSHCSSLGANVVEAIPAHVVHRGPRDVQKYYSNTPKSTTMSQSWYAGQYKNRISDQNILDPYPNMTLQSGVVESGGVEQTKTFRQTSTGIVHSYSSPQLHPVLSHSSGAVQRPGCIDLNQEVLTSHSEVLSSIEPGNYSNRACSQTGMLDNPLLSYDLQPNGNVQDRKLIDENHDAAKQAVGIGNQKYFPRSSYAHLSTSDSSGDVLEPSINKKDDSNPPSIETGIMQPTRADQTRNKAQVWNKDILGKVVTKIEDKFQKFFLNYPSSSEFSIPSTTMGSFVVVQPSGQYSSPMSQKGVSPLDSVPSPMDPAPPNPSVFSPTNSATAQPCPPPSFQQQVYPVTQVEYAPSPLVPASSSICQIPSTAPQVRSVTTLPQPHSALTPQIFPATPQSCYALSSPGSSSQIHSAFPPFSKPVYPVSQEMCSDPAQISPVSSSFSQAHFGRSQTNPQSLPSPLSFPQPETSSGLPIFPKTSSWPQNSIGHSVYPQTFTGPPTFPHCTSGSLQCFQTAAGPPVILQTSYEPCKLPHTSTKPPMFPRNVSGQLILAQTTTTPSTFPQTSNGSSISFPMTTSGPSSFSQASSVSYTFPCSVTSSEATSIPLSAQPPYVQKYPSPFHINTSQINSVEPSAPPMPPAMYFSSSSPGPLSNIQPASTTTTLFPSSNILNQTRSSPDTLVLPAHLREREFDSEVMILGSEADDDDDDFVQIEPVKNNHICPMCGKLFSSSTEKFILHVQSHFADND